MTKIYLNKANIAISLSNHITSFTKVIKFKANAISKVMDLANGGVKAHGGFHRVFGGHSIVDIEMWKTHGLDFGVEVLKDSLTSNGTPMPGTETLAKAKLISPSNATSWGSLNIGEAITGIVAIVDTFSNTVKFVRADSLDDQETIGIAIKGALKTGVGVSTSNIPVIVCGIADLSISLASTIKNNIDIELHSFSASDLI